MCINSNQPQLSDAELSRAKLRSVTVRGSTLMWRFARTITSFVVAGNDQKSAVCSVLQTWWKKDKTDLSKRISKETIMGNICYYTFNWPAESFAWQINVLHDVIPLVTQRLESKPKLRMNNCVHTEGYTVLCYAKFDAVESLLIFTLCCAETPP